MLTYNAQKRARPAPRFTRHRRRGEGRTSSRQGAADRQLAKYKDTLSYHQEKKQGNMSLLLLIKFSDYGLLFCLCRFRLFSSSS
jgi:hypothetical protein